MNHLKGIFLTLALICAIASCKKADNKNTSLASWQVTLDSASFTGTYSNNTYSSTDKNLMINISPSANAYPHLLLQALGTNGNIDILEGTYNFGITPGYSVNCDSSASLSFAVEPGNDGYGLFNITKFDLPNKLVSGTFNFIAPQTPSKADTIIGNGTITNLPFVVTY